MAIYVPWNHFGKEINHLRSPHPCETQIGSAILNLPACGLLDRGRGLQRVPAHARWPCWLPAARRRCVLGGRESRLNLRRDFADSGRILGHLATYLVRKIFFASWVAMLESFWAIFSPAEGTEMQENDVREQSGEPFLRLFWLFFPLCLVFITQYSFISPLMLHRMNSC